MAGTETTEMVNRKEINEMKRKMKMESYTW